MYTPTSIDTAMAEMRPVVQTALDMASSTTVSDFRVATMLKLLDTGMSVFEIIRFLTMYEELVIREVS